MFSQLNLAVSSVWKLNVRKRAVFELGFSELRKLFFGLEYMEFLKSSCDLSFTAWIKQIGTRPERNFLYSLFIIFSYVKKTFVETKNCYFLAHYFLHVILKFYAK